MPSRDPRYRTRRWTELSKFILSLSDVCWLCGKRGADTTDHVEPTSKGGDFWNPDNLRPAHRTCNSRKGNREPERAHGGSRLW